MRWRQSLNEETGRYEFIPIDEAARQQTGVGSAIHGDIKAFVSPVDGTVISDRKGLREHNKRNNVVSADEFTPEYYAGKAKEREDFFKGNYTTKESMKRKSEIYEQWVNAERNN